jgi:hypothetical protein
MARVDKLWNNGRTDKTSGSGNKDTHIFSPSLPVQVERI